MIWHGSVGHPKVTAPESTSKLSRTVRHCSTFKGPWKLMPRNYKCLRRGAKSTSPVDIAAYANTMLAVSTVGCPYAIGLKIRAIWCWLCKDGLCGSRSATLTRCAQILVFVTHSALPLPCVAVSSTPCAEQFNATCACQLKTSFTE